MVLLLDLHVFVVHPRPELVSSALIPSVPDNDACDFIILNCHFMLFRTGYVFVMYKGGFNDESFVP
jgi:hypothetical protein